MVWPSPHRTVLITNKLSTHFFHPPWTGVQVQSPEMLKSAYSAGYDVLVPTTPLSCVFFSTQQFQGLACVLTYAPLSSFFFPSPIWFRYSSPLPETPPKKHLSVSEFQLQPEISEEKSWTKTWVWFRGSGNERKTRKDLFFPGGKKMVSSHPSFSTDFWV